MTPQTHVHPCRPLRTPHGVTVPIDHDLATLLPRLWDLGIHTKSSCQDYGESLAACGPGTPSADPRWIDFYSGRIWLLLRADHAERLVSILSRDRELHLSLAQWTLPDSWLCLRPVVPSMDGGTPQWSPDAHVFFPRKHLARVEAVLADSLASTAETVTPDF
jgi:hypothetical protein